MAIEYFGQLPPWAVGAVSQSGGIPTGAMSEAGSNANGSYVRLASGLQICWKFAATGPTAAARTENSYTFAFGSETWTFPAAFSVEPSVSGIVRGQTATNTIRVAAGISVNSITTTAAQMRPWQLDGVDFGTFSPITYVAVGVWF